MVVGARCTGLCQELQRFWVFHTQQFPVCIENGAPAKSTQLWEALESTWASIPVEHFRHLVEAIC
jgi:predicted oxidoreductase (fatty acid repression mutant protein)